MIDIFNTKTGETLSKQDIFKKYGEIIREIIKEEDNILIFDWITVDDEMKVSIESLNNYPLDEKEEASDYFYYYHPQYSIKNFRNETPKRQEEIKDFYISENILRQWENLFMHHNITEKAPARLIKFSSKDDYCKYIDSNAELYSTISVISDILVIKNEEEEHESLKAIIDQRFKEWANGNLLSLIYICPKSKMRIGVLELINNAIAYEDDTKEDLELLDICIKAMEDKYEQEGDMR